VDIQHASGHSAFSCKLFLNTTGRWATLAQYWHSSARKTPVIHADAVSTQNFIILHVNGSHSTPW